MVDVREVENGGQLALRLQEGPCERLLQRLGGRISVKRCQVEREDRELCGICVSKRVYILEANLRVGAGAQRRSGTVLRAHRYQQSTDGGDKRPVCEQHIKKDIAHQSAGIVRYVGLVTGSRMWTPDERRELLLQHFDAFRQLIAEQGLKVRRERRCMPKRGMNL